jgi:hypothetical protein
MTHAQIGELQDSDYPGPGLGVCRWNRADRESAIASRADIARIDKMTGGNLRHIEDALILVPARNN